MRFLCVVFCQIVAGTLSRADVTYLGSYTLPARGDTYGGLSALHLSDDGQSLLAVSDRGEFIAGEITRTPDHRIDAIALQPPVPIEGYAAGPTGKHDAESLAVAQDGTIFVSFERDHRIGTFSTLDAAEMDVLRVADFTPVGTNTGFEAITLDTAGALFAIPERTRRRRDPFPVYRYRDGQWTVPFSVPRSEDFLVTGADFGPDGALYLLERAFNGYFFRTRVRRVDMTTMQAEVILQTGLGVHGNMEGISVWRNPAGETILSLLADDNFLLLLSNELAEYRIAD